MEITITKTATKLKWYMLNYPISNQSYWELLTNNNEIISNGNVMIPQETIDVWGTDDKIIEDYILSQITK
jgi:hypothetical protein